MIKNIYFITLILILLSITSARAALVTEFVPYDLTATAGGIIRGSGPLVQKFSQLKPFDSSLGQLDQVKVDILGGVLLISGTAGRNAFQIPVTGGLVPVPYTISPTVKLGIGGVTDFFDITPIESLYNSVATGIPQPVIPVLSSWGFNFTIDETTDKSSGLLLSGLNTGGIPKSIPLFSGKRSDFLDTEIISDLLLFSLKVDFLSTAVAPIPTITTVKAKLSGTLQVKYDYTPAMDPVSPIPVPGAIYLFGTALIGLIGFCKARKAA